MSAPTPLSPADRRLALATARAAIAAALVGQPFAPPPAPGPPLSGPGGAFVTLRRGGALRGCIGCLEAGEPVLATVARMARAAAREDPRFPPLTVAELPEVRVEVSLLSPLSPVTDPGEVVPGRHGLLVSRGARRGVLLPQVATEQGWDRERFLAETCRKADLPPDAWRHGARLATFEATVVGED